MRLLALLILSALSACAAEPSATVADRPLPEVTLPQELDRVLRDYEQAYAQGDAAALAALFTDDGFVLQPGQAAVSGRPSVEKALAGERGPLRLVPLAYAMADSVAYVIGTFGAERSATEGGKFVLALRRSGGAWRIAADIGNGNGR